MSTDWPVNAFDLVVLLGRIPDGPHVHRREFVHPSDVGRLGLGILQNGEMPHGRLTRREPRDDLPRAVLLQAAPQKQQRTSYEQGQRLWHRQAEVDLGLRPSVLPPVL